MRSLYWKIFISFWLVTIAVIVVSPYFVHSPWASLTIRLTLTVVFSGLVSYVLSIYLTKPLRSLALAAKSIARGNLHTRVGHLKGHYKDEIDELINEFDRMAEQLENIINSKERLLQDISHELRSPLARINVAIELARTKTKNMADKEFDRMEVESNRLNSLISEILEFARLDKSTTDLYLSEVQTQDLITSIINDANFESKSTCVRVQAGPLQPCALMLDSRLIHRAIENIIRNALHYSDSDKKIIVSSRFSEDNSALYIDIKDFGPGVPEDQLEKIFDPFYKVDSSREKKTSGYGLGLAISTSAIHLHHGTIKAFNNKEGGLCVRVVLPLG